VICQARVIRKNFLSQPASSFAERISRLAPPTPEPNSLLNPTPPCHMARCAASAPIGTRKRGARRRQALPDAPDRYLVHASDILIRSRADHATARKSPAGLDLEAIDPHQSAIPALAEITLCRRTTRADADQTRHGEVGS
jgi:hypothetical protein